MPRSGIGCHIETREAILNAPFSLALTDVDSALIECARRVQLSPSKHNSATQHYEALCSYVDRDESPLHGLVLGCFGAGSFGTGTATATSVSRDQHDVDVVIELNISSDTQPDTVLTTLYDAINGEPGTRYHGKVTRNSRCVTVEYEDGVKVDLMPVARLNIYPERASNLFHWRPEKSEAYHKPVNPYDFREEFNSRVAQDRLFFEAFQRQAALAQDSAYLLEKADAEPFPEIIPLEQKSPLVVAIQLIKRFRDIRYRSRKGPRKPPSIAINAIAIDMKIEGLAFADIVVGLAERIRQKIVDADRLSLKISVANPAWEQDIFTDRWPESLDAQRLFAADLRELSSALINLKRATSDADVLEILTSLFGENVANVAIEKRFLSKAKAATLGGAGIGAGGTILSTVTSPAVAKVTAIPKNTSFGGGVLDDIDH
jgi:hypothetical protein